MSPLYEYECDGGHRFEAFKHRREDRYDVVCPECRERVNLLMSPFTHRVARPFAVFDIDGTLLHQTQTIEKSPPVGYGTKEIEEESKEKAFALSKERKNI